MFGYPVSATFNIMSLIGFIGIAYRFEKQHKVDVLAVFIIVHVEFMTSHGGRCHEFNLIITNGLKPAAFFKQRKI
ncbi:hypothetical protein [Bacillus arachidis]|uniref:Uncharacterized protein n=1 Tax=Bacillus arachidis TaxID=2819290 RepID=A0ABS3NSK7_9BACI|nr:hypothetical protein [Bacillus arachidis]MBO1623918.1 hypothetical protein [Bacillus arachidis]